MSHPDWCRNMYGAWMAGAGLELLWVYGYPYRFEDAEPWFKKVCLN